MSDDYDEVTSGDVVRVVVWVMGIIAAFAIFFGLLNIPAYYLHWWYYGQSVNKQAQITQQGYSNQVTMVQQVQQKVADITSETTQMADPANAAEVPGLKAQRAAEGNLACSDWSQLTATFRKSSGEATWAAANCDGGVLSISSPLYVKG